MADTMVRPPCSGLYAGKKRVAVGARQRYAGDGALGSPWRGWPAAYGQRNAVYASLADG